MKRRRRRPMKKEPASQPVPCDEAQQPPAIDTPWLSERLTEAEIEALRQNQREASAYAQKAYFPNVRIHRAGEVSPEEPGGD